MTQSAQKTAAFSLLISVYHRDNSDHLLRALRSCVEFQTLLPAQIVLVKDGPLPLELERAIKDFSDEHRSTPLKIVALSRNQGLAAALNAGLGEVTQPFAARMDADDVCLPDRFERQWRLIQERDLDLVGAGMIEFNSDDTVTGAVRLPPVTQQRIRAHARTHNPFNHPTMMYRVAAVQAVGGYQEMGSMEDYWLVVRLLAGDARVDNIVDPLVKYRVGAGSYKRRGGLAVLFTEWRLQREMLRINFITLPEFVRNCLVKGAYRLLPAGFKKVLFAKFIAGGLPGDKEK